MEEKVMNNTQEVGTKVNEEHGPEVVHKAARPSQGERRPRVERSNVRGERHGGPRRRGENDRQKEFEERVVSIKRVAKVVKGGKRMRFTALVVIGDGKGHYGFANGKAGEVPDAIKKALEHARHNLHRIPINKKGTIPHEVMATYGACSVFIKPAQEGKGIIAGGPVRAILELAGVKNVVSKVYGSRAPINIIRALSKGLDSLKTRGEVKALRQVKEENK